MQITLDHQVFTHSVGKVVCVGRNYAAHAKELNNPIPSSPILFIKPASSVVPFASSFAIPNGRGSVHHELEIAILVGKPLVNASVQQVAVSIAGIGLGLDLTLRDVQDTLKEKGHPWERAKSFDGACPLTDFVSIDPQKLTNQQSFTLRLEKNGEVQQQGSSEDMLFPILPLIAHMSENFSLYPGDIILTGTPAGVGPLVAGDHLKCELSSAQQVLLAAEARVKI